MEVAQASFSMAGTFVESYMNCTTLSNEKVKKDANQRKKEKFLPKNSFKRTRHLANTKYDS